MDSGDSRSVSDAILTAIEKAPRRRINFIAAKYSYSQDFGDQFTFEPINENCEIIRGYKRGTVGGKRTSLFDQRRINSIKQWSGGGFYPLSGFHDKANRGFAVNVIYALSSCPVFRQFSSLHRPTCHRVGCTICKVFDFFDSDEAKRTNFPLELRVFDLTYKLGDRGDSAAFLSSFLDILQIEELAGSRAFGETDQYTSAIGQMFRINTVNKVVCNSCGRVRAVNDSFWTLCSSQNLLTEIDKDHHWPIQDCKCDACNAEMYATQEIVNPPIVFTVQFPHWTNKGDYKKRNLNMKQFTNITISSIKYKLVAFTAYEGFTNNDGRYCSVFMSSSGVWNHHSNGQVQVISSNKLDAFMPQLAFFSRDEENEVLETTIIKKIEGGNDDDDDENPEEEEEQIEETPKESEMATIRAQAAIDGIKASIEMQRKQGKNAQSKGTAEDTPKPVKPTILKNPLSMLIKKSVQSTGTWEGVESIKKEIEPVKGFSEDKLDEWDAELDKGHQRKFRTRREAPEVNPFDTVVPKRRHGDFGNREKKFDDRERDSRRDGRDGPRDGRGRFGRGRGGFRGGRGGRFDRK